jgi:hypothetical protein
VACGRCDGVGWVYERHGDRPSKADSDRADACDGAVGESCPVCNTDDPQRPPLSEQIAIDYTPHPETKTIRNTLLTFGSYAALIFALTFFGPYHGWKYGLIFSVGVTLCMWLVMTFDAPPKQPEINPSAEHRSKL